MQFQKLVDNREWCSYSLSTAFSFDVRLIFRGSRLVELHLALASETPQSWSNWSEAKEGIKKERHDEFLMQELGPPPYNYPWGTISSIWDAKGGASLIIVSYAHEWRLLKKGAEVDSGHILPFPFYI